MKNSKYHVFYRRNVAVNPEALARQAAADQVYRQNLLPEDIKVIEEYGSGLNKSRSGLDELKTLIKRDRVHTLYTSNLSRLFRDNYEAAAFYELLEEHDVNLILTANAPDSKRRRNYDQ